MLLIGSRQQLAKIALPGVTVGESSIAHATAVRDLGAVFDTHMTMVPHVNALSQSARYHIRNIHWQNHEIPRPRIKYGPQIVMAGDSSVFVLSRTGHFGYSSIHNSVNNIGRTFTLHLHGSCHICVSMCDQHFFVNNFNWLIYP